MTIRFRFSRTADDGPNVTCADEQRACAAALKQHRGVLKLTVDGATRSGTDLRWTFEQPHLLFATTIDVQVDHVRSPAVLKLPLELVCDV